jgi:hypothetical protein
LESEKYTDEHKQELNSDCGPILASQGIGDALEDHRQPL